MRILVGAFVPSNNFMATMGNSFQLAHAVHFVCVVLRRSVIMPRGQRKLIPQTLQ